MTTAHDAVFALFGLPMRYRVDLDAVRAEFLLRAKENHPDFFANADGDTQIQSLQKSAAINNAYRVLRNDVKRAEYLLEQLAPNLKSKKQSVPPALLETFFAVQETGEALREARLSGDAAALEKAEQAVAPLAKTVADALREQMEALAAVGAQLDQALDSGDDAAKDRALADMRQALDHINYLRTVTRNLR